MLEKYHPRLLTLYTFIGIFKSRFFTDNVFLGVREIEFAIYHDLNTDYYYAVDVFEVTKGIFISDEMNTESGSLRNSGRALFVQAWEDTENELVGEVKPLKEFHYQNEYEFYTKTLIQDIKRRMHFIFFRNYISSLSTKKEGDAKKKAEVFEKFLDDELTVDNIAEWLNKLKEFPSRFQEQLQPRPWKLKTCLGTLDLSAKTPSGTRCYRYLDELKSALEEMRVYEAHEWLLDQFKNQKLSDSGIVPFDVSDPEKEKSQRQIFIL